MNAIHYENHQQLLTSISFTMLVSLSISFRVATIESMPCACPVPHSEVAETIRKVIEEETRDSRPLDCDTITFSDEQITEAATNYHRYLIRKRFGLVDFDTAVITNNLYYLHLQSPLRRLF
ncbi:Bro11 [Heliothis virescens ascovirus 3j]|uniref:Bro11 n=1 Tax=Heliothis virescens ascovirus 3j TaxID=1561067 RepID=A0A2Z5V8N0_9VIRU|nr:Bro11 [Heliothis virescens ascovirus 3j]